MAKQAAKDSIPRGNQHLSVGKIGTWVDKSGQHEASKDILVVRGSPYTTLVILPTIVRNKRLESYTKPYSVCPYSVCPYSVILQYVNIVHTQSVRIPLFYTMRILYIHK